MSQFRDRDSGKPTLPTCHQGSRRAPGTASYIGSPPQSPPPTSPLPLPPLPSSPRSSLRSSSPPSCHAKTQLLSPVPQLNALNSKSTHGETQSTVLVNDRLSRPQASADSDLHPITSSQHLLPVTSPSPLRNYSRPPLNDCNSYCDGARQGVWQAMTVADNHTIPKAIPSEGTVQTSMLAISKTKSNQRSETAPKKAVARSALYVPSAEDITSAARLHDADNHQRARRTTPLLFNEFLTSLPQRWQDWRTSSSTIMIQNQNRASKHGEGHDATHGTDTHHQDSLLIAACRGASDEHMAFHSTTTSAVHHHKQEVSCQNADENNSPHISWRVRHKRQLWLISTIVFVTLATTGIVAGIIWRLTRK